MNLNFLDTVNWNNTETTVYVIQECFPIVLLTKKIHFSCQSMVLITGTSTALPVFGISLLPVN